MGFRLLSTIMTNRQSVFLSNDLTSFYQSLHSRVWFMIVYVGAWMQEGKRKGRKKGMEGGGKILYFNNDLSRKRECNFRAFACTVEYGFDRTQTQTKNVTFAWKKRERERRLCWEIAGPEFKKVDFYLTRVYIGQLLVNRSLYIIHVMRNRSFELEFQSKRREWIVDYSIGEVVNLFILKIVEIDWL